MGALPIQIEAKRELPDYLPARCCVSSGHRSIETQLTA
jgi:hypothetical protein